MASLTWNERPTTLVGKHKEKSAWTMDYPITNIPYIWIFEIKNLVLTILEKYCMTFCDNNTSDLLHCNTDWLDHWENPGLCNDSAKVTKLGNSTTSTGTSAYNIGLRILSQNSSLLLCPVYATALTQRSTCCNGAGYSALSGRAVQRGGQAIWDRKQLKGAGKPDQTSRKKSKKLLGPER